MGMIRAGELDRIVRLLRPGVGADNGIERVEAGFAVVGKRYAKVMPEYRPEKQEALGLVGKKVIKAWVRYDSLTSTITATWGLLYKGETYELVGEPTEIGRREGMELVAVAADLEVDDGE
jgi:head-tail adaptor